MRPSLSRQVTAPLGTKGVRWGSTEGGVPPVESSTSLFLPTEGVEVGSAPTDYVCQFIETLHLGWQIPYWEAIVLTTIGLRCTLLPLSIKTAQGSARMSKVRPLLQKINDAMKRDPKANNMATKQAYANQSKALMAQHKVNPFVSLAMPLVQLPVFMTFFFALQKMGGYYPGMESGGMLWFEDLTAADSTLILPVMNAASFLIMVELGADGMGSGSQTETFKWVMRGLALGMTPLTMHLPTGLFVYWTANNAISVSQATIMKLPAVKRALDIPDVSKTVQPDMKVSRVNPFQLVVDNVKKEFTYNEQAKAEIVDGVSVKPSAHVPSGPPPTTFAMPPRGPSKSQKRRKKQ
jgi:YidC/Oxa1 family membrane protein insertase